MVLMKSELKSLDKGAKAPNFNLKNIDEKNVSLKDFEGKILVIIFMCNHCPYVTPKMDEISKIQNDYEERGVSIVCINSNDAFQYPEDNFNNMKRVAKKKGYKYYLYDETQETAKAYGAVCTPDPFIFNKSHRLVYHGRINDAMNPSDKPSTHDLMTAIEKVLCGQEIKNWFEPSMGCSIKWKN